MFPTELRVQQERILLSDTWHGADAYRNSVPLPDTRGMSVLVPQRGVGADTVAAMRVPEAADVPEGSTTTRRNPR